MTMPMVPIGVAHQTCLALGWPSAGGCTPILSQRQWGHVTGFGLRNVGRKHTYLFQGEKASAQTASCLGKTEALPTHPPRWLKTSER